jgi:hypothetical protein
MAVCRYRGDLADRVLDSRRFGVSAELIERAIERGQVVQNLLDFFAESRHELLLRTIRIILSMSNGNRPTRPPLLRFGKNQLNIKFGLCAVSDITRKRVPGSDDLYTCCAALASAAIRESFREIFRETIRENHYVERAGARVRARARARPGASEFGSKT